MVTQAQAEADPREYLGRDIALTSSGDVRIGVKDDFALIMWEDNLKQAIINRLRTGKGELILHPDYGSHLPELLGTVPTEETLLLAKAYVKEALLQEPRISEIRSIYVYFPDNTLRQQVDVEITVVPLYATEPLSMIFRLFFTGTLQGGPN